MRIDFIDRITLPKPTTLWWRAAIPALVVDRDLEPGRQDMRVYGFLSIAMLVTLIGCTLEEAPGATGPQAELAAQAPATLGDRTSAIITSNPSCRATSPCLAPYNNVAITCTGVTSCFPFSDHVTCDGASQSCAACVCNCDPSFECCKPAGCGTNCYVRATTGCI